MAGMAVSVVDQPDGASSSSGPHRMRITSGGSVAGYTSFALNHLKEYPDRPLVLHTLPASTSALSTSSSGSLPSCLLATPKLVSVVEKIKREYMASLTSQGKAKGKERATVGIWQYTESGNLGPATEAEQVQLEDLILQSRAKAKMIHRPYLQITLSTKPLGLENNIQGNRNITCQYVMVRRRKKQLKEGGDQVEEGVGKGSSAKQPAVGKRSNGEKRKAATVESSQGETGGITSKPGKKRRKGAGGGAQAE